MTRRGAGLPIIVHTIMISEPKNRVRRLFPYAISRILKIINCRNSYSELLQIETKDNPQSHCLHILRSIVQDSVLSQAVSRFLDMIFLTCMERYGSCSIFALFMLSLIGVVLSAFHPNRGRFETLAFIFLVLLCLEYWDRRKPKTKTLL